MLPQQRMSERIPRESYEGLPSPKRCQVLSADDMALGDQLGVEGGQMLTPQTTFGTAESNAIGLDTEASQPTLPEDWLDLDQLDEFVDPFEDDECEQKQPLAKDLAQAKPETGCPFSPKERTHSMGSIDDEALHGLMDEIFEMETGEPPSSVLRAMDRSSRSADEFDPKLQYSPVSIDSSKKHSTKGEQELDYEVDWSPIRQFSRQSTKNASQDGSGAGHQGRVKNSQTEGTSPSTLRSLNTVPVNHLPGSLMLRPHRTFLHISKMLETKASMFRHSDDVVFELFARVLYSRRENFGHIQYFQFGNMFKESSPFLYGALSG